MYIGRPDAGPTHSASNDGRSQAKPPISLMHGPVPDRARAGRRLFVFHSRLMMESEMTETPLNPQANDGSARRALSMSTVAFTVCFAVWTIFSIIGVRIKQ